MLLIILAYLIGSIPTAVWISKRFFEIDIRDYGSGNAGATNTFRTLGSKWGTFVMIADMIKGFAAVKLAYLLPFYVDHDIAKTNLQKQFYKSMCTILGTVLQRNEKYHSNKI